MIARSGVGMCNTLGHPADGPGQRDGPAERAAGGRDEGSDRQLPLAVALYSRMIAFARRSNAFPPVSIGQSERRVALPRAIVARCGIAIEVERRCTQFRGVRGGLLRPGDVQRGACIALASRTMAHRSGRCRVRAGSHRVRTKHDRVPARCHRVPASCRRVHGRCHHTCARRYHARPERDCGRGLTNAFDSSAPALQCGE